MISDISTIKEQQGSKKYQDLVYQLGTIAVKEDTIYILISRFIDQVFKRFWSNTISFAFSIYFNQPQRSHMVVIVQYMVDLIMICNLYSCNCKIIKDNSVT